MRKSAELRRGGADWFEALSHALEAAQCARPTAEQGRVLEGVSLFRVQLPDGQREGFLVLVSVGQGVQLTSSPVTRPEVAAPAVMLREVLGTARALRSDLRRFAKLHAESALARARALALEVREIDKAWEQESGEYENDARSAMFRSVTPYEEVEADYAGMAWKAASVLARELLD